MRQRQNSVNLAGKGSTAAELAPVSNWLLPEPAVPKSLAAIGMMTGRWNMAINLVCKMNVESEKATATTEYAQFIDAVRLTLEK